MGKGRGKVVDSWMMGSGQIRDWTGLDDGRERLGSGQWNYEERNSREWRVAFGEGALKVKNLQYNFGDYVLL